MAKKCEIKGYIKSLPISESYKNAINNKHNEIFDEFVASKAFDYIEGKLYVPKDDKANLANQTLENINFKYNSKVAAIIKDSVGKKLLNINAISVTKDPLLAEVAFKEKTNDFIFNNETVYQKNQTVSSEGKIASEKTIRDLAARMSDRIGIPFKIESDRTKQYKGKIENDTAYINLAYATLDTPIHEILGHPIVRAIKGTNNSAKWINIVVGKNEDFNGYFISYTNAETGAKENIFTFEDKASALEYKQNLEKENFNYIGNSQLYQNLLKELETGKGKEVLDRIKRDYQYKINESNEYLIGDFYYNKNEDKYTKTSASDAFGLEPIINITKEEFYSKLPKYTLEEQQEEAIVELLGLMTAEKLDKVKDGKLISLLKRLLKEMKQFVRSLLNQREVEIDKLPDNMTIGDLSDLLAYSNSKLILPGNEVIYTTPDNQQFKTYAEASNHISELARNIQDVDLSNITIDVIPKTIEERLNEIKTLNKPFYSAKFDDGYYWRLRYRPEGIDKNGFKYKEGWVEERGDNEDNPDVAFPMTEHSALEYLKKNLNKKDTDFKDDIYEGLFGFIEKNKEYEQSKEIIEEWKKINNIQYNPEEIYSRGQEFSSVLGAYSSFDVNLMMQNLLSHIEDNEKAGGKFAISAFTKPIDKQIGHLEGGGGKIKFKIFPKSEDILWAANTDVYSGSVWDASEKVNKDKKSELLGVSYTKYPSLQNVDSVQPNLASIVDDLSHHHNELGIVLTGNNFRLEYDENIPYSTKKIIDGINKILDQKYGKLVKPEIKTNKFNTSFLNNIIKRGYVKADEKQNLKNNYNIDIFDSETSSKHIEKIKNVLNDNNIGIQPTQTNETLKVKIQDIKIDLDDKQGDFVTIELASTIAGMPLENDGYMLNDYSGRYLPKELTEKLYDTYEEANLAWENYQKQNPNKNKEYTSQALINTKIAALKEVAKKYPRSLIRSEVVRVKEYYPGEFSGFAEDELPFQKIPTKNIKPELQEGLDDEYDIPPMEENLEKPIPEQEEKIEQSSDEFKDEIINIAKNHLSSEEMSLLISKLYSEEEGFNDLSNFTC